MLVVVGGVWTVGAIVARLALGWNDVDHTQMVGTDAVIGRPDEGNVPVVQEYYITGAQTDRHTKWLC